MLSAMTETSEENLISTILDTTRTIAVVGASDKAHRASNSVMKFLQQQGYRCIPVHPRLAGQTLHGEIVYPSLSDIPQDTPVDMVDLFINSAATGPLVDEAISIGAKTVWMQLDVINHDAAAKARDAGIQVVMDRCPAIEINKRN